MRERAAFLILLAGMAILFLARLGERALWSEEVRWVAIPREMQLASDYLHPTINGHTYYDKPLGSYWLVLLAANFTGEVSETAARLPCALSGLLAVLLTVLLARRLHDERTATLAGVIVGTSFSFVFFSRHATADMENVAGVLAALYLFVRNEQEPRGWWTLGFWLILALTSLTKGLLGFALPLLIVGAWATLCPPTAGGSFVERHRWLFNRKTLLAVPLSVLVYLTPFFLSVQATGSTAGIDMVFRENIRRFFDPVNHRGPIWLYVPALFALLAPWSLLLPAALVQRYQTRGDHLTRVFFWGQFLFFTLSSSRRSYYLLPVLPAAAILLARLLVLPAESLTRLARRLLVLGYLALAVLTLAGVAVLLPATLLPPPWDELPALPAPIVFGLIWAVCVLGILRALRQLTPGRIALSSALIAGASMAYLFLFAAPELERYRTQKPFAEAVRQELSADLEQLALFRNREISFYLGSPQPIPEYHTPGTLSQRLATGQVRWVILRQRHRDALTVPLREVLRETAHPWEGPGRVGNKLVLLENLNTVRAAADSSSGTPRTAAE